MWQTAIAMLTVSLIANSPAIENENPLGPLKETVQYMNMPERVQIIYIAGIIDGMGYVILKYNLPEKDAWVACVRKTPIEDLVKDVDKLLIDHPAAQKYPVVYAVTRVLAQRRPC